MGNDILGCACILRYIIVSITLRHDTSRPTTSSSFSLDLEGS